MPADRPESDEPASCSSASSSAAASGGRGHQGRGAFAASHGPSRYFYSFFHIGRQDDCREYPEVELIEFGKARVCGVSVVRIVERLRATKATKAQTALLGEAA